MKKTLKTLAVLSFLTAGLTANADIVGGDLILGFRLSAASPSATDKYLTVDLGALSQATTAGFSLNINSYLTTAFGSNWNQNANLSFSLLSASSFTFTGVNSGSFPTWISSAATAAGNSSEFNIQNTSRSAAGTDRSVVQALGNFASSANSLAVSYAGNTAINLAPGVLSVTQNEADANTAGFTWGGILDSATAQNPNLFSSFGGEIPYTTMSQGVTSANNYVDIRSLVNGATTTTVIGSLNLDSAGNISAVPEPSTYGLMGAGAAAAVAFVRRRRKTAGVKAA